MKIKITAQGWPHATVDAVKNTYQTVPSYEFTLGNQTYIVPENSAEVVHAPDSD